MGCAYGRICGELVRLSFPDEDIIPGTYAVIGATASLAGISRMTISLCVIMLETTQDMEFLMPIMLTIIIAKWIGDLFNISLYDLHVELKCIPFVEPLPSGNMYHLVAGDVMRAPVRVVTETMTVVDVLTLLDTCTHNGFPVLSDAAPHKFCGMMLRNQIVTMLNKRCFGHGDACIERHNLTLADFNTSLSSRHTLLDRSQMPISDIDAKTTVLCFTAVLNPVPVSVRPECALSRVFVLFRSLGIRHLIVTDAVNDIVGIIGRKEISSSFDQDLS
jgi:chloride channel 7